MTTPPINSKYTVEDIFFREPIYKRWDLAMADAVRFVKIIRTTEAGFDHYCPGCQKEVAWRSGMTTGARALQKDDDLSGSGVTSAYPWLSVRDFQVVLVCQRLTAHRLVLNFILTQPNADDDTLWRVTKYGQHPSLIDLTAGSKELEGMLDTDAKLEYRRANELSAYGYSIAAFLHFRRVLEVLIAQAAREAKEDDPGFDEAEFGLLNTVKDRVRYLGDRMPQFLAERAEIHRILSEGIHQWSEERCGEVLPLMKLAVDTVLAQELERKEKMARLQRVQQQLQALDSVNSGRKPN